MPHVAYNAALFHFGFRMASVSSEISFEFKKKAHKLCKKYLGGSWKNVSLDEFSIEVLRYVVLSRNSELAVGCV